MYKQQVEATQSQRAKKQGGRDGRQKEGLSGGLEAEG